MDTKMLSKLKLLIGILKTRMERLPIEKSLEMQVKVEGSLEKAFSCGLD